MSVTVYQCETGIQVPFGFYAPITKAVETDDGRWLVEGPCSEPGADLQGEEMDQDGLRKALRGIFTRLGRIVDWEHLYEKNRDPAAIIGKGLELFDAPHPVSGESVPWLRVELHKGQPLAQKVWNLVKSGGSLGFSVAGAAVRKAGKRILEPLITTIGITAVPVVSANAGTLRLAKALRQLEAVDDPGQITHVNGLDLFVPELVAEGVVPLFRALSATSALPHSGPGIDAAGVEDLGAPGTLPGLARTEEDDEDEEEDRPKHRLRASSDRVRKAVAFHLYEALAERIA